jgi:circadian clock protein KaiC
MEPFANRTAGLGSEPLTPGQDWKASVPQLLRASKGKYSLPAIPKCPTGIQGLDELTFGGLPRGRPTLVCGSAGCGKTLLGMEFLVRGATQFGEPGVCLSFEETAEELAANVASLGFDIRKLVARKKLAIDHVFLERSLVQEAGDYDLEALFIRLGHAIDSIGAKRVLLDSVESLFSGLDSESILRAELRRLFRWLKDKKLTCIITAERGSGTLTRHGLEEYISDCVILLDHRVTENVFTRRLRVVKYRGSTHGTNEYPFLIDADGLSVLPVTSVDLKHVASQERISTGVPALDDMLGGKGYYRGGSILISGTAGTGKSSLTAHFVNAACARGERCAVFSFEESASQMVRNMKSIGIDLGRWVKKGLLHLHAARPTTYGLEMHLVRMHRIIADFRPSVVVVDPLSGLLHSGTPAETSTMLLRLIDSLKEKRITAMMTSLTGHAGFQEETEVSVSSLVDAWLVLRDIESAGERNRILYLIKARGVAHSNQIREFILTDRGVELRRVGLGEHTVLTGSARTAEEGRDAASARATRQQIERRRLTLDRKRKVLDAQMAVLRIQLEWEEQESRQLIEQDALKMKTTERERGTMAKSQTLDARIPAANGGGAKSRGGQL